MQAPQRWPVMLGAVVVVLAGIVVYSNSFLDAFVFDDIVHITANPAIQNLWPVWDATTPVEGASRRPLVGLSLALDYALGGLDVRGYHVFNLTVHLLAALVLFGVVRRTLAGARLGNRFAHAATLSAAVVATAWVVHPLQTESVTYVIQRAESMMGLFYLLTVYCFMRGTTPGARPGAWLAASVAASALGMCSKEVMATVPVAVLLYDRAFVSSSFAEALRRRWIFYAALAATLLILVGLALSAPPLDTVGFHVKDRPVLAYTLTQARIIVTHYLRLAFWPSPLILDYNMTPISFTSAGFPALFTLFLLLGTIFLCRRTPAFAFPLAWFFLILAPTSSIIPVADLVFEHRMYLPLAGILALFAMPVALVRKTALRVVVLAGLAVCIGLWGVLTYHRNEDYRSELAIWTDTVTKVRGNGRAWKEQGDSLKRLGRYREAIACFDKALEIDPRKAAPWYNKGNSLDMLGRYPEAIACFDKAVEMNPRYASAWNNKGGTLNMLGRPSEAIACFDKVIEINPRYAFAWYNKALTHEKLGNRQAAIRCCRTCLEIARQDPGQRVWIPRAEARLKELEHK